MSDNLLIIARHPDDFSHIEAQLPEAGYTAPSVMHYSSVAEAIATTGQVSFIFIEDFFRAELDILTKRFPAVPYLILADDGPSTPGILVKSQLDARLLSYAMQAAVAQTQLEGDLKTAREQNNTSLDYMKIFEESPIPMWIYHKDTLKFLTVNPAAISKYGYSEHEFQQMTVNQILADEDLKPTLRATLLKTSYNNKPRQFHRKKSGEVFQSHLRFYSTKYNGFEGFLVAAADVQKQYEQQQKTAELVDDMQKKQQRYGDILANVSEVLWMIRIDTFDLLYINDACAALFGYTSAEMKADRGIFFSSIYEEDRQLFNASIKTVLKNESSITEFRIRHRDGTIKNVLAQAHLKKGENGEPDTLSGMTLDITQIRSAEQALKDKVIHAESILEAITDGFYALNKDWRFTYTNQEFERIFDRKREDLLGKCIWEVFPHLKEEDSEHGNALRKATQEQLSMHAEQYSHVADKWLAVTIYPSSKGISVYVRDISEERKLKEAVINAEKKLRAIINNTDEIIWSVNQQYQVIESNKAFWKRVEKVIGKPWHQIAETDFPEEEVKRWHSFYKRALAGEAFSVILETPLQDYTMYEEVNFTPILDTDNNITSISCFSHDITKEYYFKAKIAEDERNLRAMVDHTEDMIWSVDRELQLISANQAFQEFIHLLSGKYLQPGDVLLSGNISKAYSSQWVALYQRAFMGERFSLMDEKVMDGQAQYSDIQFIPIFNGNEVISVTCFVRDITERRRDMLAIEQQNEKLREIAWIQSHQVRSHVASILGLCQVFNYDDPADKSNVQVLNTLKSTTEELDNLIQEITARTRVIEGK